MTLAAYFGNPICQITAGQLNRGRMDEGETSRAVQAHRHERVYDELAWDELYRSRPQAWSGDANSVLVTD